MSESAAGSQTIEPSAGHDLSEFPEISFDQWKKAVQTELKDIPFEKKLISKSYEGIAIKPLYTAEDVDSISFLSSLPGEAPFVRGQRAAGYVGRPWDISQELAFPSTLEFNTAARNSLERGLTALNVVLDRATRSGHDPDWADLNDVGAGGLSIATLDDLHKAFEGLDFNKVSLFVRSGASGFPFAALLVAMLRKKGVSPRVLQGCIEIDPLGVLTHEGRLPHSLSSSYREMAELTRWAYLNAPKLQTICIHTRAWHESGGTAVHELAFSLATAIDYFRALHERDLSIDRVAPRMRMAVTVGSQFFMEVAKLRAMRLLWSNLVQVLGGDKASQKISMHVRTSLWNKTRYDRWVNILRATTEAFSGVLGGCDSLQVGAFDECFGESTEASRRLARNTQLILQHECDLTHVIDPLGGSWYVESLTQELAEKAWALVQEVEKEGGMAKALQSEFIQKKISESAHDKKKDLACRRTSLVGTTHYANIKEPQWNKSEMDKVSFQKRRASQVASYRTQAEEENSALILDRLSKIVVSKDEALFDNAVQAALLGATLGEMTRSLRIKDGLIPSVQPLKIERWAHAFEKIREPIDALAFQTGVRPAVFLMTMGPLKQHKPRADFSKSFFEAAGFDVLYFEGFNSVESAADAFIKSKAKTAVLCSSDETYPELVPAACTAIRERAKETLIVLAGNPGENAQAYQRSGIDGFIHLKSNWIETLLLIEKRLGIVS